MNEYKKRLAQQGGQKQNSETAAPQGINGIPNSVLNDVFAGKRRSSNEMMGHRVDPAPSVMARMSQAFGMDFSGVQVYRSDAMNGTGMQGMAQGNKVVLGSDVDLNTQEGQAILGHEFSHIRAQSMGIGTGNGLLQDAALEHQADNEGLLAARGMSISGESMGMSTGLGMAGFEGLTPLGGGMSATAAAPMQASGWKDFWSDLFGSEPKQGRKGVPASVRRKQNQKKTKMEDAYTLLQRAKNGELEPQHTVPHVDPITAAEIQHEIYGGNESKWSEQEYI